MSTGAARFRLIPEEAARLLALSLIAVVLLAIAILRIAIPDRQPALTSCRGTAARAPDGKIVCGANDALPLTAAERLLLGDKLDLNAASASELELIPGIGAELAARIVADRDSQGAFASIAEVERVHGVGPRITSLLAEHVHVRAR
jgi:competence protein ComEA